MVRRNPYVILGVLFGTRSSSALRFFTRRRRQIRRAGDTSRYNLQDLNAALKRAEEAESDPDAALDIFRVPANPSALRPRAGHGVLNPAPRPLEPHPAGLDADEVERLREAALRELVTDLLTTYGHRIPLPSNTNRRSDVRDTNATR
jgi:hypothetical protein